jgi:hypothetical protein
MVQLFLNCPVVRPDDMGDEELNVDEYADTEVEQQARRDQERVLAAMRAKKDAPAPAQVPAAEGHMPIGSRRSLMEIVDFCVATSVVDDGIPPTHPTQLSDGGGADVGGVGGHQTQDIDTETTAANPVAVEETTAGHQTQDAGAGASNVLAAGAGGFGRLAPLKIVSDSWARQRALEHREQRLRSNDEPTEELPRQTEGYIPSMHTPEEKKTECQEWNVTRYGEIRELLREMSRVEMIEAGLVSHQATTSEGGYETAEDTRTPSHESPTESDAGTPTADEVEAPPARLGAYDDTPLDVRAGVVAPAVCYCYVVTDGVSYDGDYRPAQYFMQWYGEYGAEQYMRPDSIAKAFSSISRAKRHQRTACIKWYKTYEAR